MLLFGPSISSYEKAHNIVRGTVESVRTAMIFGEYYPNPCLNAKANLFLAMCAEGFGTFILVLMILILTENSNLGRPDKMITPVFIGLTVTSLISLIAPFTQAGFNPARDFGPRIVAFLGGWGKYAFPDKTGGVFVYVVLPLIGGILAAQFFNFLKTYALVEHGELLKEVCRDK